MSPYIRHDKVENIIVFSEYRSKCSHRLCPHSLELPFVDWSNKGGTQNVLSEKKDYLSSFYLFCLNTTLRNQHPVKSKIWQSHPWSQSCPDFLLSRHYTPENRNLQAARNVIFCKYFLVANSSNKQTNMQNLYETVKLCAKMYQLPHCLELFN